VIGNGRRTLALWAAAGLCVAPALAANPAEPPDVVIEIRLEGNRRMSDNAVLANIRTRVGERFDAALVKADEQRLLQTRQFSSVLATRTQTDKGVIVTFQLTERPVVAEIKLLGNRAFKETDLVKDLPFRPSDPLDRFNLEAGRRAIEDKYRRDGFGQVEVTIDEEGLATGRVVYRIREGPRTRIRKVRFQGNTHFYTVKLLMTVGSKQRLWPFVSGALDADQVDRDVDTLRNLYVDEGYLDAQVARRLDYSDDRKTAVLTFLIDQGLRYRVNAVLFRGNMVFADEELAARLKLSTGAFFTSLALQRDAKAVQDAYGELGYIDAAVRPGRQFLPPDRPPPAWAARLKEEHPALLNVTFDIEEKDSYRVGEVIIRGNTVTQDRVIRRELRFFPEQMFNTVAAEESRKRLMETRLFDKVSITPIGQQEGVRDALVEVQEGQTANFIIGVGVNSNTGLVGNVTFTQRNFDILAWPTRKDKLQERAWKGAGQTLTISAEPGIELMQFHIDWFEPYLFDREYSLGQKVFYYQRDREKYDEARVGYVPSLGHRFANKWYGEISARIEGVNIDNLDDDAPPEVREVEGSSFLAGPKFTLVRDRTDSRWTPTAGDRIQLSYEQIFGDFTFSKVGADYHYYRTVWTDALDRKHILASRLAAGQIFGDAPVFERFYGGGIGSLRGFAFRGISPRSRGTDEQIGGDFMVFAGTEYIFPLIGEMLQGVVFLDTGTVEEDFEVTTYRSAAGVGVRWVIPFMGPVPMSFDFGFPITKDSQDDTQVFSFSVGWTF
jgi:outer membrane protein assembly complex protein YaeT